MSWRDTGRATCEPGWEWSIHVGLGLGQTRWGLERVGVVRSGTGTAALTGLSAFG